MKLKTLLIVVIILGLVSLAAYYMGRPPKPVVLDTRVGTPLAASSLFEQAATVRLSETGKAVTLKKGAGSAWTVSEYYDFPADFEKLSRLVNDLTSAKIDRLVTQNADLIKTFEFKDTGIAVSDSAGKELWGIKLGKNAQGGGRLVRFGDENKAFLSRLNTYLDVEPKNWADSTILTLKSDDIAKIEMSFSDGAAPIVATRAKKEDPFTSSDAPSGQRLKSDRVNSLISSVSSLRFSETSDPADANAVAAKANSRTLKLTTFDNKTFTVQLGRKPEQKIVKAPEAKKDGTTGPAALGNVADLTKSSDPAAKKEGDKAGETKAGETGGPAKVIEPVTETIPAGPVFVVVTNSDSSATINTLMQKRAFQIYESTFTGLPQTRTEMYEPMPTPTPTPIPTPPPTLPGQTK